MRVNKVIFTITTIIITMFIASCTNEDVASNEEQSIINQDIVKSKTDDGIDVDLTELSSTMIYSEVYNMMMCPDDYAGKIVKASGYFNVATDTNTGKKYFTVFVADAGACCTQGIEFELEGDNSYPEDYPELGEDITVIGTFSSYEDDGVTYINLKNATLEVN